MDLEVMQNRLPPLTLAASVASVLLWVLGKGTKIYTKEREKAHREYLLLLTYSTDTLVTFSRTSHAHTPIYRNLRQQYQRSFVT